MINILIPMAGKSQYFSEGEYPFPKPLLEIGPKTIIEHVINNLSSIGSDIQFIFVLNNADCKKFHLDNTLNIITNQKCQIIRLENETKGAACSALMAITHINTDSPLVIANSDQIFRCSLSDFISKFKNSDAGVMTFESVHPRWSYVRLDERQHVVETAEKRPISRHAIAGLYYFQRGQDFVESAMSMVQKDAHINGSFFISSSLNEMILKGKTITSIQVKGEDYHTFYAPQKIKDYEMQLFREAQG